MNWRHSILIPALFLLAVLIGKYASGAPFSIVAVAAVCAIGLLTLQNPENGLMVLVFSMLLSPQIVLADIPGRPLTIRIDDFLIIVVFFAWLARISLMKEWKGLVKTRLDLPIFLLLTVYVTGTTLGIFAGSVNNSMKAFFFTLKYCEYFILYWTTANIITSKEAVKRYLIAGLITAIVVTIYAYSLFGRPGGVYAPFEWAGGEPASLGGYFLVVYAVLFALLLHVESAAGRIALMGLILFILPPFIRTLSRASYLAFVPMLLTMFLLTRKRKLFLGMAVAAGIIVFPLLFPGLYGDMIDRIRVTFTGSHSSQYSAYQVAGQKISDQSALERIASWKWVAQRRFGRNLLTMLVGSGVTSLGFVEGQFFLVLGESGAFGVAAFYGLLFLIFRHSYRIYRSATEVVPQSLSLAALCALIALLFQSLTTNTFIIVRIMEPFWFLVAIVMILPDIYGGTKAAPVTAAG